MRSRTNSAAAMSWASAARLTSSHSESEKRMLLVLRTSSARPTAFSPFLERSDTWAVFETTHKHGRVLDSSSLETARVRREG